jgi:hypothetical protein
MTIAGQPLRHNPNNSTSPAQNYTIVNYHRRGESSEQAASVKTNPVVQRLG